MDVLMVVRGQYNEINNSEKLHYYLIHTKFSCLYTNSPPKLPKMNLLVAMTIEDPKKNGKNILNSMGNLNNIVEKCKNEGFKKCSLHMKFSVKSFILYLISN